jgi:endonuclease/exonuclease/phosphatase (EEP) superfamily protein YafD
VIFVAGGAMLAGLFWAPRGKPPVAPASALGVPDRPVRVLAYDLYHNDRGMDGTVAQARTLQPPPDFVMLGEAKFEQIGATARAWGLAHAYHPAASARQPGGDWPGVCLLSRFPLYDGRDLRTGGGQTFGVWAYAVVDGRKFAIAALHLPATTGTSPSHVTAMNHGEQLEILIDLWRREGSPPLIAGGDFNQPPTGENDAVMTRGFTDALAALGKYAAAHRSTRLRTRIEYVLVSKEWQPVEGGVIEGDGSDHRPVWAELRAAPAPGTTRPPSPSSSSSARPATAPARPPKR